MNAPEPAQSRQSAAWQGALQLGFGRSGDRTRLQHRIHRGPYRVLRPFYPEADGTCHVYLVHPPGALATGDVLTLDVQLHRDAAALLTTPGATKLHRRHGDREVCQRQCFQLAAGASLEYLPQETIAFDACLADLSTRVELAEGAEFLGWELLVLGRPACGEAFARGSLRQRLELWRGDRPLLIEQARYRGGSPMLDEAWGLGGRPVLGSLWCVHPQAARLVEVARAALPAFEDGELCGVTAVGEVLVVRWLGHHAERGHRCFVRIWQALRPEMSGRTAVTPRVWAT